MVVKCGIMTPLGQSSKERFAPFKAENKKHTSAVCRKVSGKHGHLKVGVEGIPLNLGNREKRRMAS